NNPYPDFKWVSRKTFHALWIVPLALFLALTPWISELDLYFTHLFYQGKGAISPFHSTPLFSFLYRWGTWPAGICGAFSGLFLFWSYWKKRELQWRKPALVLFLTYVI